METQVAATSSRTEASKFKPRLIFWEVTKGCNLRCIHCRATATELSSPTDLPTGRAIEIIKQISDFANPILVLSGGYPWPLLVYAVGALLLSMYALRPNIERLRQGTEPHVPPIRIFKRAQHG